MGESRRRFPLFQGVILPVRTLFFCVFRWVAVAIGPVIRMQNCNTCWRRSTELATSRMRTGQDRFCSLLHRSSLIWRNHHDSSIFGFPHRTCKGTLSTGPRLEGPGAASAFFPTRRKLAPVNPHIDLSRIILTSPQSQPTSNAECQNRPQTASVIEKPHAYTTFRCR